MDPRSFALSDQMIDVSINLHGEELHFVTKPGLPSWNEVSPSTLLLGETVRLNPDDSILQLGSSQGVLAILLARQLKHGTLFINDYNDTALEMTQKSLELNNISSYRIIRDVEFQPEPNHLYKKVIVQIPKGRQLIRKWLIQAYQAMEIDGKLFLAGANNAGIQSTIKDAQSVFGNGCILGYKKGNRLAEFSKQANLKALPEWSEIPGIAPGTWVNFDLEVNKRHFSIHSLPGVFSYDHLDSGTEMLLNTINISPGEKILDVGCGYGIIGIYAASEGAETVHLVDNNLLAIASARETLTLNHINNANVFTGDLLNPLKSHLYNQILSNPPFHAGFKVDYQVAETLIKQSYQSLLPGGILSIVANRFIHYTDLIKAIFGNVSVLKESSQYYVLSGLKSI